MIGVRLSKTITYYTNQSPRGLNLYHSLETDSSVIFVKEISSIIHSKFGSFASGFRRIFFYQSVAAILSVLVKWFQKRFFIWPIRNKHF
jgi:hypothetical protein